jgi:hypothetical protein
LSRTVFWAAGLEIMLVVGVSMRILPLLERHIRDADWVGGLPPGALWHSRNRTEGLAEVLADPCCLTLGAKVYHALLKSDLENSSM